MYISTRGQAPDLSLIDATLTGLATDGGLYVPQTYPNISENEIKSWQDVSYQTLAFEIFQLFAPKSISQSLIDHSYTAFTHSAIAPTTQLDANTFLLELFHGPTLAFKDYALQPLGQLIGAFNKQSITVLGATSGDTGSAAIMGLKDIPNCKIVILHPKGRVSDVQRKQMTTIIQDNVINVAINGNFDDCQNLVKAAFNNADMRKKYNLTAINSINISRILAQIVYYCYTCLKLNATPQNPLSFCVPTGNFGNILAGWIAKKIGFPIKDLIIASNRNDILTRTYHSGIMAGEDVIPSLSPSMDIQISSNFERLLFELSNRDSAWLRDLMTGYKDTGSANLTNEVSNALRNQFHAYNATDAETSDQIKQTFTETGMLVDPHTAVGLVAAQKARLDGVEGRIVSLACAHPAKFPDAVINATGKTPQLPDHYHDLFEKPEQVQECANDLNALSQLL